MWGFLVIDRERSVEGFVVVDRGRSVEGFLVVDRGSSVEGFLAIDRGGSVWEVITAKIGALDKRGVSVARGCFYVQRFL